MKGRSIRYSATEMTWLEVNRLMPISDYHVAFCEAFDRSDISAQNLHALRKRKGWKTGRTGQFEKGQVAHNKGMRCPDGVGGRHPNARKTQFKKGGVPHNTNYLGHERVSKDGYVEVSIDEVNPHTGFERRYVLKHLHEWQKANGPLPRGMCLKNLDGNRLNCDPANWIAIPRGVLPRLNGGKASRVMAYDSAPAELKPTILTLARVEHKASELKRRAAE